MDTGGPDEYLHCSHAEHLSSLMLFCSVQNLQAQVLNLDPAALGFCAPQTSQISASGYICSSTIQEEIRRRKSKEKVSEHRLSAHIKHMIFVLGKVAYTH